MHKIIYISALFLFFLSPAQAQKKYIYQDSSLLQKEEIYAVPDADEKTATIPIDQIEDTVANYEKKKPDTSLYQNNLTVPVDSIKYWKNLKDYAYVKNLDSLLQDRKKAKTGSSDPGLLNRFLASGFLQVLLWTIVICFVLFIIYRLFLADGVFKRESRSTQTAKVEEEVINSESDFDALIKQALQNSNYRQAVRYQYLKTLHALAGKKIIEMAPDKTNFQYVQEIVNPAYRNDFASLTLSYEYVWYGEFAIDKNIYEKIEINFNGLNKKLYNFN